MFVITFVNRYGVRWCPLSYLGSLGNLIFAGRVTLDSSNYGDGGPFSDNNAPWVLMVMMSLDR